MAKKTRLIIRKPKKKTNRIIKREILRGVEINKGPVNPDAPKKTLTADDIFGKIL